MRTLSLIIILFHVAQHSNAQFSAGAGIGTLNVLAARKDFKTIAPTLMLKYVGGEERQEFFLDATLYTKTFDITTDIENEYGEYIGEAKTKELYSIKHLQLGFKRTLMGDFTETRSNWFIAAGGVLSFIKNVYEYDLPGYKISDEKFNRTLYGFHFSTGGQLRISKMIILEFRGNFDFLVKPIENMGGANHTYMMTSSRLGIVIPLIKY